MIDQSQGTAEPAKAANESLSESDLIALMAGEGDEQPPEEDAEDAADHDQDDTDAEDLEAEEVADEAQEDQSQDDTEDPDAIDFDSLSDEQWELVRTKLKSKAAADIQRLKRQAKEKDAQIAALQNQQPQGTRLPAEPVESRFLTGIETQEQLAEKVASLKKLAKDTDRLLDDHEDFGPNDLIDVGDQSYTKKQLRQLSREIRETLDEAVPYQQTKFQRAAMIEKDLAGVQERLKAEVRDLQDDNSPVAKTFKGLTESELFQSIFKSNPEAKPVLTLLAGFGAKAILGKAAAKSAPLPAATGKIPKANPPSTPSGAAAAGPARGLPTKDKAKANLERRFLETGSADDLVKAMSI